MIDAMKDYLSPCILCPRLCPVDRAAGKKGPCGVSNFPIVSKIAPSYSEESFLSGNRGSGCIWLTGCNMGCLFCQNYSFNLEKRGNAMTVEELSNAFLWLQEVGCHNVHWITPTHQVTFLAEAWAAARSKGLTLPIVYNCGGYESLQVLQGLEGIVDIYLPDFKYWDEERAFRATRVRGYPDVARQSILEMHRQVGELQVDSAGLAVQGLVLRHLVMPDSLQETRSILTWTRENLGADTAINLMPQYYPAYHASKLVELARPALIQEWRDAMKIAEDLGLRNVYRHAVPDDLSGELPTVANLAKSRTRNQ